MKYLGLLGIASLLTTLVAAVPLEKRVYVYQTVTKEVVVTVDLTTTITVRGSSAGSPSSLAVSEPTLAAAVDAGVPDEPNDNYDQPAPSQEKPAVVEQVTAPEQPAPVVEPVPTYVAAPEQPVPVVPAPEQQPAVTTEAAPVQSASTEQAPSGNGNQLGSPGNLAPGAVDGPCDPNVSCKGKATVYDIPQTPNNPPGCGQLVDGTQFLGVALSGHLMGTMSNGGYAGQQGPKELLNPYCGRKVQVSLNGKTVIAEVVDKCPKSDDPNSGGCVYENVDLTRAAAAALGYDDGRYEVEWHFVS